MINKMKEYLHQFTSAEKVSNKKGREIRETITTGIFPDIKARFEPYLPGSPSLTYILPALPVFGGTNEFTISMISYDGKENTVYLNVGTMGILGDVINRKLKRSLKSFNFIENTEPKVTEVSLLKLLERQKNAFHLKTANETIEEIAESMQIGAMESRCIDEIVSPDLGLYLETVINLRAKEFKTNFCAKYFPQAQKLEISK